MRRVFSSPRLFLPSRFFHSISSACSLSRPRSPSLPLHLFTNPVALFITSPYHQQQVSLRSHQQVDVNDVASKCKRVLHRARRRPFVTVTLVFFTLFGTSALLLKCTSGSGPDSLINVVAYEIFILCYAAVRLSRDIYVIARMLVDYHFTLRPFEQEKMQNPNSEGDVMRAAALEECHWRNARRLRDQCFELNGGVYLKIAQTIANMGHLLPEPYALVMQKTLQEAPISPWPEVRSFLEESLGRSLAEVFRSIESEPIASASLAQVHLGTLHNGEEVAIKVQHRFLQHTILSDVRTVRLLVNFVHWLVPAFDYNWLAAEMSYSLPRECDFRLEGANADRCRKQFSQRHDVLVPKIYWDLTSERVLVMERMRGVMVTDVQGIKALGLKLSDVSDLVAQVFSESIYRYGFTHADPHAGNLFVEKKNGRPALVLLDHGLYSEISCSFRLLYAHLWRALITANRKEVKYYAEQCGAGELYEVFASMLTRKSWSEEGEGSSFVNSGNPDRVLMQQTLRAHGLDIQTVLASLPREMVLLLKTNDILRNIDNVLGTNWRAFIITVRVCQQAINQERIRKRDYVFARVINLYESFTMESRIAVFQMMLVTRSLLSQLRGLCITFLYPRNIFPFALK